MFTDVQKRDLVAWRAGRRSPSASPAAPRAFARPVGLADASGAFVTLKRGGELRGCIGTLECRLPLEEEIARVAISAAREIRGFRPLSVAELSGLEVELSILGPLERIDAADQAAIVIGRHGLVVEQAGRRGLLLPQVATERGWNREEFLAADLPQGGIAGGCVAARRGGLSFRS